MLMTFTSNYNPGTSFSVAAPFYTVTYVAADSSNLKSSCNFTITLLYAESDEMSTTIPLQVQPIQSETSLSDTPA
eukprot:m.738701 g.738701  ORF g.738701 m.738701 type:complete len:75 (-) comp58910_c0_seq2:1649-1873(-)